ncbi:MAG: hypothetical protein M3P91_05320 [Actinomycetota bacterium]|nr:hypothetical protein [Actinomycetota bacterium]
MSRTAVAGTDRTDPCLSSTLDEALERIGDLAARLWAVRQTHVPVRTVLGRHRCAECARAYPCPTVLAVGTAGPGHRSAA